jgi:hypothetical protein
MPEGYGVAGAGFAGAVEGRSLMVIAAELVIVAEGAVNLFAFVSAKPLEEMGLPGAPLSTPKLKVGVISEIKTKNDKQSKVNFE